MEKARLGKLIRELYEYDHAFLTKEGADHFTKPFGFEAKLYIEEADPRNPKGLTLYNNGRRAEGVAADRLALQIASKLGVSVPSMFGRGSQLRIACAKILEKLNEKTTPSKVIA